jgi:DNA-binding transcriptional MerR regulator
MKNLLRELNIVHEDLALWEKIFLMVPQRTTSQNPLNSKIGR